ncbi:MAG TPA: hypothetical protein VK088_05720, partial [Acidimicrobiia bacterium]|nr:hypothetical protein [Acidimicrobiia bacterium]
MIFTYKDLTVHLADFLSGSDEKDARDYRRAAVQALREAADAYPWTHYVTPARLNVFGPFTEGTVEYDATGGAYERLVTLSDSTWPAWAQDGMIDLDGFKCEVSRVIDTTRLTLAERACPPADIGAGTEYSLYRESYPAPADFYKPVTGLYTEGGVLGPEYVEPSRILESGRCRAFTIVGSTNYQGALAFRFHPVPQEDASYSYWYRRTPRSLTVEAESTGTIAVTAGSTTVAGTGTAFSQQHVGCVLRLSPNTDLPTGYDGDNPAQVERVIVSVASTTGLEVDAAYDE